MRYSRVIFISFFVGALLFLISCNENQVVPSPPPPLVDVTNNGFENKDIADIFARNCAESGCHSSDNPVDGLSLATHSDLIKGSMNRPISGAENFGGDVVIPFNPQKSLLYQFIEGNVTPSDFHSGVSLTSTQIGNIKLWIEEGAKNNDDEVPFSNPTYRVFVCNQASDVISVIDGDSKVVSRIVSVDFNDIPDSPHMVKTRDGFLYVSLIGAAKFLKFSIGDYTLVGEVSGIEKAGMIQIHPNGKKAYVSRSSTSPSIFNTIFVIDIENMVTIKEINLPVTGVPHGIALTPDGTKLYVANLTKNRISIVDAVNDEFVDDIVLSTTEAQEPMQTIVSPDGKYLYVSARATGKLLVIDTNTETVIAEVDVAPMPMHLAVNIDGSKIYVPSMGNSSLNIIEKNGTTWTKIKEVTHPALNMLHGCDLTPDGKFLYISSRNNDGMFQPPFIVEGEENICTVGIFDTQAEEYTKVIEIEEFGAGLTVEK